MYKTPHTIWLTWNVKDQQAVTAQLLTGIDKHQNQQFVSKRRPNVMTGAHPKTQRERQHPFKTMPPTGNRSGALAGSTLARNRLITQKKVPSAGILRDQ